jgi:endonuclease/exonuclease/phosphatase family metal-dependent hydrolase
MPLHRGRNARTYDGAGHRICIRATATAEEVFVQPQSRFVSRSGAVSFALVSLAACAGPLPGDEPAPALESHSQAVTVPAKGTATTFDIGSWNLEWFGDASNGPSNEPLQLSMVHDVIAGADMDVWGVAEVVSEAQFSTLVGQLPGYAGLLANDPSVVNGPAFYSDFNNAEQKVGLLYKTAIATVQDARVILTGNDSDFAGRPPLQVTLHVTLNGASQDVVVIVLHAKCCSDTTSWQRRSSAAVALKSYLDTSLPAQRVLVIGDFNDDLDVSITAGKPSPYQALVTDSARYLFPTKALTDAHIATTTGFADAIDHHLNSNEQNASYVAGSVEAYRVDQFISNYATTTSDHYPVLSRYTVAGSGGGGGTAQVILNEILANETGSDTAGEFIELVNVGTADASIGGWTLSDGTSVRHSFASGTTLAAGKAIVVFAGAGAIPGGLSNAVAASTGALSLANGGDTVRLKDGTGFQRDALTYPSSLASSDGVSMNRSPDGSATGGFVLHTTLAAAPSSPGKRTTGAAW